MKKLIVLFVFAIAANMLVAQILKPATNIDFKPTTGDTEMDAALNQIHDAAVNDINKFQNNVVSTFKIPAEQVSNALKELPPGDVFMAAQVANAVKKPFVQVVDTYKKDKSKGWGAIAKDLGIKPGSAEFHQMKKDMKDKNKGSGGKGNSDSKGKGNGKNKDKGNKEDKDKDNKGGGKKDKGGKDSKQDNKPADEKPSSGTPNSGRG